MGTFFPFREAIFDGCISVSALQWLCYEQVGDVVLYVNAVLVICLAWYYYYIRPVFGLGLATNFNF